MLSSVLVYNLTANIQEDDLQHLELFTEYGRLALEDSGETPFQKLQFLVRDWSYPYEAPWGAEGGKDLVGRRLEVSERQHPELQDLRRHIKNCFSSIEGFLLPHPGLKVSTDPAFDGRMKDIETVFIEKLREFVPLLLAPDKVVVKKIGGNEVRCKEIVNFFKAYIEVFKGDEMPEPKSMLQATSEANNLASLSEAKDTYIALMESVCGGDKPYINERVLDIEHCRIKDQTMDVFGSRRKMGGEEGSAKYKEQLEHEVEVSYGQYKSHNESKNIFKAANTPITLGAVAMVLYVACQIFSLVGLLVIANIFNLAMMVTFAMLATWAYSKYSGNLAEIGSGVDSLATTIWDSGLQPAFSKIAEEGTQYAARKAVQRMNSTSTPPSQPGLTSQSAAGMSVKKRR
jgi:atlastin